MSAGYNVWDPCAYTCPASTITIRPPPFLLTIPGPSIYCPEQPLNIEQHNPCVYNNSRPLLLPNRGASIHSRPLPSSSYISSIYRF